MGALPDGDNGEGGGYGAIITAGKGDVGFLLMNKVVTDSKMVLIRARIMSKGEGASIAIGALDSSFDGSITMNLSMKSEDFDNNYKTVVILCPNSEDGIYPIIQLGNIHKKHGTVELYVDDLQVYDIPKSGLTDNMLLSED